MTKPSHASSLPAPGRAINPLAAAIEFARSALVDFLHKVVYRRVRSRTQVTSDYDLGQWSDELHARGWEKCANLDDYLLHRKAKPMKALVNGRLTRLSASEYYTYRTKLLADVLAEESAGSDTLIELGSGTGRNLFTLSQTGHWKRLTGLELSSTGRDVLRSIAGHFKVQNVDCERIDLLDPQSEGFARLKGATVFTFYCLEQLPSYTEKVLRNLAEAGVKRVIHIEPTLELFHWWSIRDLATIMYVWRQDYQRTLVRSVSALEQAGIARVKKVRRLNFAPTCRNDPTLIVWDPVQR